MSEITFPYQTIRDINVRNKQILMRADYNVPMKNGEISDDFRIESSIPTIKYLLENDAKIVIISHLGRPKNKVNNEFSLAKIARKLSEKLNREVKFVDNCVGEKVKNATKNLQNGEIVLLENLRFHAGEEENNRDFAKQLVDDSHAEIFVEDGFGVSHRAHASTVAVTEFLPSVAGFLLEKEYLAIKSAIDDPNRPLTAIIGGSKVSDKIPLTKKFIEIADNIIIGGIIANNFLEYLGFSVGESLIEKNQDEIIKNILESAKKKFGKDFDEKFILPLDVAIANSPDEKRQNVSRENVKNNFKILDLGTKTIEKICKVISKSGTVIWNGDLGIDSTPEFSHASSRAALELAKHPHIISVIGGGNTSDFVRNWDSLNGGSFTHVSTGGGASLELMAGNTLPGIAALSAKNSSSS